MYCELCIAGPKKPPLAPGMTMQEGMGGVVGRTIYLAASARTEVSESRFARGRGVEADRGLSVEVAWP